jgi:hypothetical protein
MVEVGDAGHDQLARAIERDECVRQCHGVGTTRKRYDYTGRRLRQRVLPDCLPDAVQQLHVRFFVGAPLNRDRMVPEGGLEPPT